MEIDLVLRWGHILGAMILTGGLFFQALVWWPAIRGGGDAERAVAPFRGKWAMWVGICTLLLLGTGLTNSVRNIQRYQLDTSYHMWVGVKLLVGLGVFFLAAILAGRTSLATRIRTKFGSWLGVATLACLFLAMAGGYMRQIPRTPKVSEMESANNSEVLKSSSAPKPGASLP